jgi:hypothetical protein
MPIYYKKEMNQYDNAERRLTNIDVVHNQNSTGSLVGPCNKRSIYDIDVCIDSVEPISSKYCKSNNNHISDIVTDTSCTSSRSVFCHPPLLMDEVQPSTDSMDRTDLSCHDCNSEIVTAANTSIVPIPIIQHEQHRLSSKLAYERRPSCIQQRTVGSINTQQKNQRIQHRSLRFQEDKNIIYTIPCRASYTSEELNMIWWKGIEWQSMVWRNTIEYNYERGEWQTAIEEDNFCFYNGTKQHPAHVPIPAVTLPTIPSSSSVSLDTVTYLQKHQQQQQKQQQQYESRIIKDDDHHNEAMLLTSFIDVALSLAESLDAKSQ